LVTSTPTSTVPHDAGSDDALSVRLEYSNV